MDEKIKRKTGQTVKQDSVHDEQVQCSTGSFGSNIAVFFKEMQAVSW